MICEIGFDTPLYTRTGWPKLGSQSKFGEILPLYGDYADGFWDRNLTDMPGDYKNGFRFRSFRNSTVIATEQLPKQSNTDNPEDNGYPFFTCELGGGMMTSYHRRINIDPMDIYSIALIKLGSGSNLPGYYMYHGGTNPEGKLTTMNEEQDTKFTNHNDLPVKTYDFQAPIGEFGQINHHYHLLRRMHIFLKDFGSELALMSPFFPASDDDHLRWSVRSDGKRGFVFVNNYERLSHSGDKKDVVFDIELPSGNLTLPSEAIDIPQNSCFFMPFNMDLGGVNLKYSTAQPVTKITDGNTETYFFKKNEGVTADFVFDVSDKMKFEYPEMKTKKGKHIHIKDLNPQLSPVVRIKKNKKHINIVLLEIGRASCRERVYGLV